MNTLIVEDDIEIAKNLIDGLTQNNFICTHVADGQLGFDLALKNQFQLIITDIMLPGLDGLEMITRLRSEKIDTPVLILTAKRSLDERVLGLQSGGDDYLVKPFAFVELLARAKNLVKRYSPTLKTENTQTAHEFKFCDLSINLLTREVYRNSKKIELQAKEFQLLDFFMRNPNIPLTKNQILEKIWGYNFDPQTNVVDVLVYRLRGKVDKDYAQTYIQTIKGIGYVLKTE